MANGDVLIKNAKGRFVFVTSDALEILKARTKDYDVKPVEVDPNADEYAADAAKARGE